ncbi:hypothetical protein DMN91_000826 [Ooceraea biroi]|uniref:Fanconi anemia group D2 protein n=1 Tax=Ooceraea biroi TaxID=2015173 RepID=A0A026WEH3_OOCBI|nr:Fanconi anemia group D2 protein homolog [Ooceraea biroi]EZA54061.1 Fanconi anemia group D2 protein [Ooceraea biroi]RLU27027.1 hypothetical protein DMN91_000826 [Ooceraea biroi]
MDRRKLKLKGSLHRNLQSDSQSSERADSIISSKQASLCTTKERSDSFIDRRLSGVGSSALKPLNSQSSVGSNSSMKSRKRNFYEIQNDASEEEDLIVSHKLSKTAVSRSKLNSQVSMNTSVMSPEDTRPSENSTPIKRRYPFTNKSRVASPKITEEVPKRTEEDSDLDVSFDEPTVIRKKHKTTQNTNTDEDSPLKKGSTSYRSPIKPITKSNISQKKQHDTSKELYSATRLEKRKSTDKLVEKCKVNSEDRSFRKQDELCVFSNFLQKCGITLSVDDVHVLNVPASVAKRKMNKLLNSKQFQKKDIINTIDKYVQNEGRFERMLNDMELSVDTRGLSALNNVSLARILLEFTEIQTDVYNIFISKLNEFVLLADTPEKIPWAILLLHQFRFLDTIVNVDTLTTNIEQLLETCPLWFQHELILFLPDILSDVQHQSIAQILIKMLEENNELINVILNCITTFNLSEECLEEYKIKVLQLLKTNMKIKFVPSVIRFLLNDSVTPDIIKQTLLVLRNIEMQPLAGDKVEECYKNQVQIVKTLKMCMLLVKDVVPVVLALIKDINKNAKPMDLIILLLVFSGTTRQKSAETLLKQNIRCGFYRISLLHTFYNEYKEVVQELQTAILQLASKLLKSEECVFVNFAIEWFRLQFVSQKDMLFKQREIVEKIILLMGNNDQTVKHALTILCKMTENTVERDCLISHCNHLRILLEKIDCFGLEEVGTLGDLLHGLCLADDVTSESLRDDLFILLQKQLSVAKPITKCKGVMAAVMAIKHLAGKVETCDQALELFNKVMKSVKSCSKSQPLFYDQLSQVIVQTEHINANFLQKITSCIEDEFINTYMTDTLPSSEDLVPKFGLNKGTGNESENCVLNLGNKRSGSIAPVLFRLLRVCNMRLSVHGELQAIDALLGCEILMPGNFDIPEPPILDLMICSINWFREIITGFVTQTDLLLQEQILKRLDTLIDLQGELNVLLTLCDTKYQPPPCYFHYFPLPPFVKMEHKTTKKGKKSSKGNKANITITENEPWETGSILCSKNPAYFRKFDAKIAHLLDIKTGSQSSSCCEMQGISIKQVCFLTRELLAIFENEPSESFVKDLIHLLPKICSKLDDIVNRLRQENNHDFREGAKLLLRLLTKIFDWKGFLSVTYNILLREGLRTLARQVNEENAQLRSCKELVAESYKYFESLSDVATEISLATALVNMCQSLMKHSETYTQQYKDKHAKLAYGFLCLEWPEDKHTGSQYKLSINQLLNNWMDNEPLPLQVVTSILKWLPNEVSDLENVQSTLTQIPSVNRNIFHLLYKKLFDGLIKGINISLLTVNSDPKRIKVWHSIVSNVQKLVQICKTLKTKSLIQLFLRYMPLLIKQFLNVGMPILEHNLKYQTDDVTSILKMMQSGTRYLHAICCDCTEKKNLPLTKYVPAAKSILERLIYSVKGMLVLNDSATAFWMGNLVNKNLDGREILSQTSSEETAVDMNAVSEELVSASSEILDSDLSEDLMEETDDEDNN